MFLNMKPNRITVKGFKKDDCTINAVGNALGISYDLSRKIMQTVLPSTSSEMEFRKKGVLKRSEFQLEAHVRTVCEELCEEVVFTQKKYTQELVTLEHFAQNNKEELYLIIAGCHLTCVNNGVILDTWNCKDKKVRHVYKINKKAARNKIKELAKYYKLDKMAHFFDHVEEKMKGEQL